MFRDISKGDTVLVSVSGDRANIFEQTKTFLVAKKIESVTPTRFTLVDGMTYKKKDGCSYPYEYGQKCQPYDASKEETSLLEAHNNKSSVVGSINKYLYLFGRVRIKRDASNLQEILKQAEVLSDLVKAAG